MKKSQTRFIATVAALAIVGGASASLAACASPAPTPSNSTLSPLAADFATYSAAMDALLAESNAITDAYDAVTGKNYTNDQTMYDALVALDPKIGDLLATLQSIHPSTPQLQALHSKYMDAWIQYQKSVELTIIALKEGSASGIAEANAAMATANKLLSEYKAGIAAVKKEITG